MYVFGGIGKLVTPGDCKSSASGIVGSSPATSTKFKVPSVAHVTGIAGGAGA